MSISPGRSLSVGARQKLGVMAVLFSGSISSRASPALSQPTRQPRTLSKEIPHSDPEILSVVLDSSVRMSPVLVGSAGVCTPPEIWCCQDAISCVGSAHGVNDRGLTTMFRKTSSEWALNRAMSKGSESLVRAQASRLGSGNSADSSIVDLQPSVEI
jgi:hypothetical protein